MNKGIEYKAFLSYSHKDKAVAEWLHRALENFKVPKALVGQRTPHGVVPGRLSPIFRDENELAASSNLSESVTNAITATEFLIVICSPNAAASNWVNQEIIEFKRQHGESRVLAIIATGEPYAADAGGVAEECFPSALIHRLDVDGSLTAERIEPMAADIRPQIGSRRDALLKLAATLLYVSLDDLVQRDIRRRNRQLSFIAAGATIGMLVTGWLAVTAMQATDEALEQRNAAEDLVEFMLGDLRQKLEPVGRLDVMDSVGEKALDYYEQQDHSDLDAASLGRRARALHLIGEMDDIRGDSEAALASFQRAADSTAALLRMSPNDVNRIFDHSQSEFWVGYVAWQRGEFDTALDSFEEYLRLANQLVAAEPENMNWQSELGYAHGNLGTMAFEQRRWEDAETAFSNALSIAQMISASDPTDANLKHNVAINHSWLSTTFMNDLRFAEARPHVDAEIVTYQEILRQDPQNRTAQRQLLLAKRGKAQLSIAAGDLDATLSELLEAETLVKELIALEPDSTVNLEQQVMVQRELAEIHYFDGRIDDALNAADRAMRLSKELLTRDDTILDWKVELARCELIHARILLEQNRILSAKEILDGSFKVLMSLQDTSADIVELPLLVGISHLLMGDIESRQGNTGNAASHWSSALEVLSNAEDSMAADQMTALIHAMMRLGREPEAGRLVATLTEQGDRHPMFARLASR